VNADNNDAVVVDISEDEISVVRGFIPTGWYPTGRRRERQDDLRRQRAKG
jgi:hypothetical protein